MTLILSMVSVTPMVTHSHDNDNDPFPFVTLAACTRNVMEFLELTKGHQEERADEGERDRKHEQKDKADRDYIAESVRRIEAFERRANGLVPHRSRRQQRE